MVWFVLESGDVFEIVFVVYLMVNIDIEIVGLFIIGNVGVCYVKFK